MKLSSLAVLAFAIFASPTSATALQLAETDAAIIVSRDQIPILTYHKAEMPPPAGVSEVYRRSGFIHPLHTPTGEIVTSIHASDHIHQMGLWHAWVKTKWRGEEIDFWNLGDEEGTLRFVETLDTSPNPARATFTVRQHHVALATEEVVLEEILQVRVQYAGHANIVDYDLAQTNVTDAPLLFPAYRYGGGIAFRAPKDWGKTNDSYLTSTNLDRSEGHATRAHWCAMHGPTGHGEATVVIMGSPSNHDAPQRMRIWPRGPVFFNFVPAQDHAWQIAPGRTIHLRYRVLVFDGQPTVEEIAPYWTDYAEED